jgi:hypothetical protein
MAGVNQNGELNFFWGLPTVKVTMHDWGKIFIAIYFIFL